VRQLEPALGDRVLVMGQGLVGLLITAFLRASGARVMAVDIAAGRRPFAERMGAEQVVILGQDDLHQRVRAWTEGFGVDSAVLATAAATNTPTEQVLHSLRDRGRVVVVGKTKVDLPWEYAYGKEIELRFSRSYGPGRYDSEYEWSSADYPIGYVRWTEQRNFEACLHAMKNGSLDLHALTTRRVPFRDALAVYNELLGPAAAGEAGVVLEYETPAKADPTPSTVVFARPTLVALSTAAAPLRLDQSVERLDVIGAGNFARTMLLPHLKGQLPLGTVVNNTALSCNHVRTKFGFAKAETKYESALQDTAHAGVLIATRHNLHAPLVLASLAAHRHVFVEKPLCLTRQELAEIETTLAQSRGSVQVGFNRRFSGAGLRLKQLLEATPGARSASFRVMAGALDPAHWYANHRESGGRILGEACHFLDFFCFLFGSKPVRVSAQTLWPATGRLPFADSFAAQVEFADGSCGQLVYTAEGDPTWPKEVCTVFAAGLAAQIENFQTLTLNRQRKRTVERFNGKGHAEQMAAWSAFLRAQAPQPMTFADARQSMLLTFAVLDALQSGRSVELSERG